MLTKQMQFKKIMQNYDTKRLKANRILTQKKEYIYKEIPEIKKIDQQLSLTGIKISKLILQKPDNINELIKLLQHKNKSLITKKQNLLTSYGYSENFLEMKYECNICKDTGYVNNKQCRCLKQQLIDFAYDQSNLKKVLDIENFLTFDFNFYSDEYIDNEELTPRQNMTFIYNHVLKYIEDFNKNSGNLIFYGDTGLGKTFLCNCIAKSLLDAGYTVLYLTAFELFHIFEKYKFNYNKNDESKSYFNTIFDVDLLIIDDLGTEFNTVLTSVDLFNCINTRILNKKPTIISTNLHPNDWKSQYSDRIASRLLGHYKLFKFYGTDIRLQKKLGYR